MVRDYGSVVSAETGDRQPTMRRLIAWYIRQGAAAVVRLYPHQPLDAAGDGDFPDLASAARFLDTALPSTAPLKIQP